MDGLEKVVSLDTDIFSERSRMLKAKKPNVKDWKEVEAHLAFLSLFPNKNNAVYIALSEIEYGKTKGWSFVEDDRQNYFYNRRTGATEFYFDENMINEFRELLTTLSLKFETDSERFEGKKPPFSPGGRYTHMIWLTQLPSVQQLQTIAQILFVTEIGLVGEDEYKPRWLDK